MVIAAVLFAWAAVRSFDNIDQDAWIYFTYLKRFFERPFSFQPGHVSYGATSPLHVVFMAPIFHLTGDSWLAVAKAANFALVFVSIVLLHRAARADSVLLPATIAIGISFETLLQATAAPFETGVTCATVSWLLWSLTRGRLTPALVAIGILPLARPELLLVSITGVVWLAYSRDRQRVLGRIPLVVFPAAVYFFYMWSSGAGLVPSSVVGRAIIAREYALPWWDTLWQIARDGAMRPYWALAAVTVPAFLIRRDSMWPAWIVIAPMAGLYLLAPPPPSYMPRYLVPMIPALLYAAAVVLEACYSRSRQAIGSEPVAAGRAILNVAIIAASVAGSWKALPAGPRFTGYPPDMILQKDLAAAVAGAVREEDKVLMYEIQGQYYFPGFGVSADGIVGSETHAFLRGEEAFDELVARLPLKFVVTFNAFNYRPIFKGTPLVALYQHDLVSAVGDEICLDRYCYTKIATNPHFSRWYVELPTPGLNTGETLRFYGEQIYPELRGQLIQWNSVYRVRAVEPTLVRHAIATTAPSRGAVDDLRATDRRHRRSPH